MRFTVNTFDLGLIKVFNVNIFYKKTLLSKLNLIEKKKNKILIDLVDDKTAIKFMDLFGKKKFELGAKKRKGIK